MKTTAKKKPFALLYSISRFVLGLVAPPRPTEWVVSHLSLDTLINLANLDGSLPYHRSEVTALVWELKYRANSHAAALAGEYVADLLLAEVAEEIGKPLLIPIPMHKERRRERGYNQTELLCEAALSVVLGETPRKKVLGDSQTIFSGSFALRQSEIIEYAPDILVRTTNTTPQQGLARHKRLKNIRNSMKVTDPSRVKGRVCIVVDDVSTTGATFAEARRALKAAGARVVKEVALARS